MEQLTSLIEMIVCEKIRTQTMREKSIKVCNVSQCHTSGPRYQTDAQVEAGRLPTVHQILLQAVGVQPTAVLVRGCCTWLSQHEQQA